MDARGDQNAPTSGTGGAPGGDGAPPQGPLAPEQWIGPYKLIAQIGEGAFGTVHLAEQREPVRRRVALKFVKLGMDSREVIARFDAERQALAMMDHPNVATVFDAGATEAGRPYFAMEYVQGLPITEFCDEQKLSIAERVLLFITVCHAVQHAHQKGVIHRDLKPSNILVTLIDGQPVPKVIDFGIAKATSQSLTQHTLYTETGRLMGTPEYLSPEQAGTSGLEVDTRSDIYSLGVVLYELLSGSLPFESETLRRAGFEGTIRLIKEVDPPRLTTRLERAGKTARPATPDPPEHTDSPPARRRRETYSSAEIAAHRDTDAHGLLRQLRGDLDWIVHRAMEKSGPAATRRPTGSPRTCSAISPASRSSPGLRARSIGCGSRSTATASGSPSGQPPRCS